LSVNDNGVIYVMTNTKHNSRTYLNLWNENRLYRRYLGSDVF